MKEIDKELQATMPSPATSKINVSYRLKGQNSDGKNIDPSKRKSFIQSLTIQVRVCKGTLMGHRYRCC